MGDEQDQQTTRAGRKWVHGLDADAPAHKAARLVVDERLRRPTDLLGAAVAEIGHAPEAIHRLRVATRRAQAALDSFAPLLDKAARRKARRAMQRIRRAAGPARICDVHEELFAQRVNAAASSRCAAIGFVLGRIHAERETAIRSVGRIAERWPPKRLQRLRKKALRPVNGKHAGETFGAFGARAVAEAQATFVEASRQNLRVFERLHDLRKAAKATRYTLEIFRSCMTPEAFDQMYSRATEVQRRLGDLNDTHEMLERLRTIDAPPAAVAAALHDLRAQLEREQDLARDRFLDWWTADRAQAIVRPANLQSHITGAAS
ncbi:MAG: CHAD domain-containing protein [Phycisphaerales bacterium]